jgi:hypothetical protein
MIFRMAALKKPHQCTDLPLLAAEIHTLIALGIRHRAKALVIRLRRHRPCGFDSYRPLRYRTASDDVERFAQSIQSMRGKTLVHQNAGQAKKVMPAFFAAPRSKVIVFSHPAAAAERSIRQSAKSTLAV